MAYVLFPLPENRPSPSLPPQDTLASPDSSFPALAEPIPSRSLANVGTPLPPGTQEPRGSSTPGALFLLLGRMPKV